MSANTKIVVLRRKELLYTGIFAALGVLFVILLLMLLLPGKGADTSSGTPDSPDSTAETAMPDNVADLGRSSQFSDAEDVSTSAVLDNASGAVLDSTSGTVSAGNTYIPGIYTTELILGSETANVEVIVSDHAITSVSIADPSETLTTMYPLLEPTMESLNDQLCEMQDPSQVTYSAETRYTSLVLLEAVKASLEKAKPKATPEATGAPDATATSSETDGKPAEPTKMPTADINPAA
ncbi:MAG: hypothetical protein MSA29_01145 [Lachnospiraceae bacterium]|nr:hypothetical protein [Lachnospiraceae bacterium]